MRLAIACTAVAVALTNATGVSAQSDSAVATFLARARTATAKYADRGVAIADGYRAVGPETPAMGQHWVQPSLLVAGRLDPAAPQILEYATVAGRAVLVGVAFAVPLTGRQSPPDGPVSAAQWHAHGGTVAEEIVGSSHAGMGAETGERVAVLHAWVWTSNPAGVFEAQNWSLPFLRAALTPPPHPSVAAAQALALGTGSLGFYEAELRARVQPDSAEGAALALALRAFADTIARWRASRPSNGSLTVADVDWLAAAWVRLRDRLAEALGPAAGTRLRALDGL
jgi:hypothetical protein